MENIITDFVFLTVTTIFFVFSILYVKGCERLK